MVFQSSSPQEGYAGRTRYERAARGSLRDPMPLDQKKILKPVKKLRKLVARIDRQPTPEQVHDLRTNCRQLETIFSALAPQSKSNGSLLRQVSRIRKRAGKVRDFDVLTNLTSTVHLDGEEECTIELLEHLGAQRKKRARRLATEVNRHRGRVRNQLKRTPAKLMKRIQNGSGEDGPATIVASTVILATQLSTPEHLSMHNLHPYRLKVKELRALLRMAEGSSSPQLVNDLGRVKDAIGEWHDWNELVLIARKVLEHHRCLLLGRLKKIAYDKYGTAKEHAESLRKQYVKSGLANRKKPGRASKILAEPVWQIIARLAS
jgi:CHAD domain-containing protein